MRESDNFLIAPLEPRLLLSALQITSNATTLNITGTPFDDAITLAREGSSWRISNHGWSVLRPVVTTQTRIVIRAEAGNDLVRIDSSVGSRSGFVVMGQDGNDTLLGGPGADRIAGGLGNDSIDCGAGNDRADGNEGDDTINGNGGSDVLQGQEGNDRLIGGYDTRPTSDLLLGGAGDDQLFGGSGTDRLYGEEGNDRMVTVGGGSDQVWGGLGEDSFWTDLSTVDAIGDASPAEEAAAMIHRVSRYEPLFGQETPLEPRGQALADPTPNNRTYTYRAMRNRPLFATDGPSMDEVIQGGVGSCYLLVQLASYAQLNPTILREAITELGDGTYAVRFRILGQERYFRIDSDLAVTSSGSVAYARLGRQQSLWIALLEKAWTFARPGVFRSQAGGPGSYAWIEAGWMSEVADALGKSHSVNYLDAGSRSTLDWVRSAHLAGRSITVSTDSFIPPTVRLVENHAYAVSSINYAPDGTILSLTLRNPWGFDGAGGDEDGYVMVTAEQAYMHFSAIIAADA
jgi:hypothetical protein